MSAYQFLPQIMRARSSTWALVMLSVVIVALPAFIWVRRHQRNLVSKPVLLDNKRPSDWRLIISAVIFGVGWGLSGLCPASTLITGFDGNSNILVFVITMTIEMTIELWLSSLSFMKKTNNTPRRNTTAINVSGGTHDSLCFSGVDEDSCFRS